MARNLGKEQSRGHDGGMANGAEHAANIRNIKYEAERKGTGQNPHRATKQKSEARRSRSEWGQEKEEPRGKGAQTKEKGLKKGPRARGKLGKRLNPV